MRKTKSGGTFAAFAVTLVTAVILEVGLGVRVAGQTPGPRPASSTPASADEHHAFISKYCASCHNARLKSGGLALEGLDVTRIADNAETWEKVVRKLRAGLMPPAGRPRADEPVTDQFRGWLQDELDHAAAAHPDPGRTETFHRLNRVEYRNAVRDLLSLDIDVANALPADDSSYGFDNMAGTLRISPSLMERYLDAAKTISRLAVGSSTSAVDRHTYRLQSDVQQHDRIDGLPFGTRGGLLVDHLFPQDGEYEFILEVEGGQEPERVEITIDGFQATVLQFQGRRTATKLTARVSVKAGPRPVGVAFFKRPTDLVEQTREPFQNPGIAANMTIGGAAPYLTSVTIAGPYTPQGPGETPSRRRIFTCGPTSAPALRATANQPSGQAPAEETACAARILTALARRAYRGTAQQADVQVLQDFFKQGRTDSGTFDGGVEYALRRLLVDPKFLFRVEPDPTPQAKGAPVTYRVSDVQLASRLSFFLWSSIPDDELLTAAEQGRLRNPTVFEKQVKRMLADPRSSALTENFAAQWLLLRRVADLKPADPYARAFDDTLRQSFRRETELFFDSVVRDNRSVVDLLTASYTFLNERLALHYGVPNVRGTHFRRVELPADSPRRGLLGQGSILTLTSHPVRTSPVLRGKYILNTILGTPPPDPPANVPAFKENTGQAKMATVRERMASHRANPVCASCHTMIDPAGFALENFDAIGRWRTVDESFNPIDTSGTLPDGTKFSSIAEFRAALVRRPERFANTVAEKLLVYALGRGLEYYDMPAVRKIVKDAAPDGYKLQALILGVAKSYPFVARRSTPMPAQLTARH
jgi:hypothetical protein